MIEKFNHKYLFQYPSSSMEKKKTFGTYLYSWGFTKYGENGHNNC